MKATLTALSACALMMLASPVSAQPLAAGEISLHIETTAQVAPDTALVPINLTGTGPDEKAAARDLKAREAELMTGLARLGIGADKVELQAADDPRYAEVIAVDVAMPGAAREAACDAAAGVSGDVPPECRPRAPAIRTSRMAFITVEDLTKLPEVMQLGNADDYYPRSQMNLFTRDPAAAKAKAVQQAIAQARAEAEAYAAAMGYRVVRIVRVSNAKPTINLPDIVGLIGGIALGGRSSREADMQSMAGATVAGAAIDFVIAPK